MTGGAPHNPPSIGNDVSARPSREAGAGEVSPAALAPAIFDDAELFADLPGYWQAYSRPSLVDWQTDILMHLFAYLTNDAASEHANRIALACPGELIAPHSQTDTAEAQRNHG